MLVVDIMRRARDGASGIEFLCIWYLEEKGNRLYKCDIANVDYVLSDAFIALASLTYENKFMGVD